MGTEPHKATALGNGLSGYTVLFSNLKILEPSAEKPSSVSFGSELRISGTLYSNSPFQENSI